MCSSTPPDVRLAVWTSYLRPPQVNEYEDGSLSDEQEKDLVGKKNSFAVEEKLRIPPNPQVVDVFLEENEFIACASCLASER